MSKPTIPEVIDRFCAYYADHPTWGSLHIVLDDGNTEDSHVAWCREHALERGDSEGAALADILLRMSRTQRHKIADVAWRRGYEPKETRPPTLPAPPRGEGEGG